MFNARVTGLFRSGILHSFIECSSLLPQNLCDAGCSFCWQLVELRLFTLNFGNLKLTAPPAPQELQPQVDCTSPTSRNSEINSFLLFSNIYPALFITMGKKKIGHSKVTHCESHKSSFRLLLIKLFYLLSFYRMWTEKQQVVKEVSNLIPLILYFKR